MQPRKGFRVLLVGMLLAVVSLSCKLVDQVNQARTMATEVDLGGLATQVQGIATQVDLNAVSTQLGGVMTEMPGVLTQMPGVMTEMPGVLTQVPGVMTQMPGILTEMPVIPGVPTIGIDIPGLIGTPQPTPQGFPADIPVMSGTVLSMDGSSNRLEYTIDTQVNTAVEFYRQQMGSQGWVESAGSTVTADQARLNFQKGGRIAHISIEKDFFFGVVIKVEVEGS